jgi:hypothetical protein
MICSILALTAGNPVYLISTKSARRVWLISKGASLLLLGTWSYLGVCRGSVLPLTRFCICLLDFDYECLILLGLSRPARVGSNPARTHVTVWEGLSGYLRKVHVGGLSPHTLYNVYGFSLPTIKTDRHHITEKLLSMVKTSKQTSLLLIPLNIYAYHE